MQGRVAVWLERTCEMRRRRNNTDTIHKRHDINIERSTVMSKPTEPNHRGPGRAMHRENHVCLLDAARRSPVSLSRADGRARAPFRPRATRPPGGGPVRSARSCHPGKWMPHGAPNASAPRGESHTPGVGPGARPIERLVSRRLRKIMRRLGPGGVYLDFEAGAPQQLCSSCAAEGLCAS